MPKAPARTPVKDQAATKFVKAERKPSRASRLRREISGERLFIPAQHHAAARIWLAGWSRGTADGVDSFQRRPRRPTTREFVVAEALIESLPAFIARTAGGAS